MANEALRELQLAVDNFKEVVDRLAEIKIISENVKASAVNMEQLRKELTEYTGELTKSADKVETLCAQIIESNKQTAQLVSDKLADTQKAVLDSNEYVPRDIPSTSHRILELYLPSCRSYNSNFSSRVSREDKLMSFAADTYCSSFAVCLRKSSYFF